MKCHSIITVGTGIQSLKNSSNHTITLVCWITKWFICITHNHMGLIIKNLVIPNNCRDNYPLLNLQIEENVLSIKIKLLIPINLFSLKHEIDLPAPQFWPCRPMCWSIHISIPLTLAWLLIIFQQLHNRVKIIMQSKSGTTYFFFQSKTADKQHGGFLEMVTSLTLWGRMGTNSPSIRTTSVLSSVQAKSLLSLGGRSLTTLTRLGR